MSLFEVKCPLCKGTLWIDSASGKVKDHQSADHQKSDFSEFLKAQKQGKAWEDKMKKAKEDEAKRKAEIDKQFKEVKDQKDTDRDEESPFHSPLDWD